MRWPAAGVILVIAGFAGCDRGARKDLPQRNQFLEESQVWVYVFPDRYPNLAHKCAGETGMWTDTDRDVWIVYHDPLCGAGEQMPIVIDNIRTGSAP